MAGSRKLDAATSSGQCTPGLIPVNVRPDVAIAAHRQEPTPYTMRAANGLHADGGG
jgi:hypothetical protein